MPRWPWLVASHLLCVLFLACAPRAENGPPRPVRPRIDGAAALSETAALVEIVPRHSGSEGAARAAQHIYDRLAGFGLRPSLDVFTDQTPAGPVLFRNVICRRRPDSGAAGDLPLVILISHYDTRSGIGDTFAGANDSGSSSGLLLELARTFAAAPPAKLELLLAFVDGEECQVRYGPDDGLHGSRRLVTRLEAAGETRRTAAVIVLDMIGDRDLRVTVPRNSDGRLLKMLLQAAEDEGRRASFALGAGAVLDDHVPFLERGIPAIVLIDFEFGSAPGLNDYWHTPEDTLDKLSADSLATVGNVVLRLLDALDAIGETARAAP